MCAGNALIDVQDKHSKRNVPSRKTHTQTAAWVSVTAMTKAKGAKGGVDAFKRKLKHRAVLAYIVDIERGSPPGGTRVWEQRVAHSFVTSAGSLHVWRRAGAIARGGGCGA